MRSHQNCPCWHGKLPAPPWCESVLAWCIDHGTINGIDVSDWAVAASFRLQRHRGGGDWSTAIFVDERCTTEQAALLVQLFSGALGSAFAALGPARRSGQAHQRLHAPDRPGAEALHLPTQSGHGHVAHLAPRHT
jgi:hypothetical protein